MFKRKDLELYLILGTQDLVNRDYLSLLEEALEAGITLFQFREKGKNSLENNQAKKYELAKQALNLCQQYKVPFIVDDDLELALKLGADGLHIGQDDIAISTAIKKLPKDMILGYSASNLEEMTEADKIPAVDYVGLGPIFSTNSKADAAKPLGIKGLKAIMAKEPKKPIVAIGGINQSNFKEVLKAGVDGISVISAIAQSEDVSRAVKGLKL